MEKIEVETKETRYVAFDGTQFNTEAACLAYEGSLFGSQMMRIQKSIIHTSTMLNLVCATERYYYEPFTNYYTIVPKTRTDINVINQILASCTDNDGDIRVNAGDCDKMIILGVTLGCNTVMHAGIIRVDDWVKKMSEGKFTAVSTSKDTVAKDVKTK